MCVGVLVFWVWVLTYGVLAMDLCVCVCDGRFSTAGRYLPYLPIAVSKRLCREM